MVVPSINQGPPQANLEDARIGSRREVQHPIGKLLRRAFEPMGQLIAPLVDGPRMSRLNLMSEELSNKLHLMEHVAPANDKTPEFTAGLLSSLVHDLLKAPKTGEDWPRAAVEQSIDTKNPGVLDAAISEHRGGERDQKLITAAHHALYAMAHVVAESRGEAAPPTGLSAQGHFARVQTVITDAKAIG